MSIYNCEIDWILDNIAHILTIWMSMSLIHNYDALVYVFTTETLINIRDWNYFTKVKVPIIGHCPVVGHSVKN